MQVLLVAIALVWAGSGFLLFSHPEGVREFCRKVFPAERVKRLAPLPALIGAVLLAGAAFDRTVFWPSLIVGAAGLAKGIYLFLKPVDAVNRALDAWFFMVDVATLKRNGIIIFVVGIALMGFVM